jgi:hypothetical protein
VSVALDAAVGDPTDHHEGVPAQADDTHDRRWLAFVAVVVVVGFVMRITVMTSRLGNLDSDEAVVGMTARAMLHGHFRAFFWDQDYAGTAETALAAAVFAVTGAKVVALKGVAVALSAVSALLVWRVGRRCLDERTAQVAALLVWIAPTPYIWFATKTRGFYWVAMVTGLLVLLSAQRIAQEGSRHRDWLVLGLAAGIGWWTSPTVAYFAVPAALWLVVQRPSLRRAWPFVPAALLGASPWLWHNLQTRLSSFHIAPQPEHTTYARGLGRLLWQVTPMVLDLRRPYFTTWVVGGAAIYLVVAAAVVVAVVVRKDRPVLVLLGLVTFPWIYASFPGRWFVGEGRYALFLTPFLFLTLAWLARRRRWQAALVAVLAVLTAFGLHDMRADPARHIGGDVKALEAAGADRVWSDYWTSYRLMFESHEKIVSSSGLFQRSVPLLQVVANSQHPAWAYPRTDGRVPLLRDALAKLGVNTRLLQTPNFNVVIADRPVNPESVPPGLRL